MSLDQPPQCESSIDAHAVWLSSQDEDELLAAEERAVLAGFGSDLERLLVKEAKAAGTPVLESGRIRTEYIKKFLAAVR